MAAAQEDMQNPLSDFSSASGSEYNTESEYDDDIISEDEDIDPALPRASRSKGGKSKKPSASEARAAQLTRQIYADFDAVNEENPQPMIFSDDGSHRCYERNRIWCFKWLGDYAERANHLNVSGRLKSAFIFVVSCK
ncbi:hypothetical protein ACNR9Z_001080 [Candidozyma auris]